MITSDKYVLFALNFAVLDLHLYPEEHRTKEVIKNKFKDIFSEFYSILLLEDPSVLRLSDYCHSN